MSTAPQKKFKIFSNIRVVVIYATRNTVSRKNTNTVVVKKKKTQLTPTPNQKKKNFIYVLYLYIFSNQKS